MDKFSLIYLRNKLKMTGIRSFTNLERVEMVFNAESGNLKVGMRKLHEYGLGNVAMKSYVQ